MAGYDLRVTQGWEHNNLALLLVSAIMSADEGVDAGLGSPINHMPTIYADDVIVSDVPDNRDRPLDREDNIDDAEYAHIMRRIGIAEGEPGTSVSAFNSSI